MATLTDKAVKALKPPEQGRYIEWFDGGLGVRVSATGRKSFIYWYRSGPTKRLMTLGEYPSSTVAAANAAHAAAVALHRTKLDPLAERRAREQAERLAAREADLAKQKHPTLRRVVAEMRADKRFLAKASAREVLRRIDKDVLPFRIEAADLPFAIDGPTMELGDVPLEHLRKRHAVLAINAVRRRGDRIGDLCAADFVRLGKYAEQAGFLDDEHNRLRDFGRSTYTPKDRALGIATDAEDDDRTWELVRVLDRLPHVDMHPITTLCLLFVLATGQRPGQCAEMPKAELRKDGALWTIAAARCKTSWRDANPKPHHVPLSPFAQSLVRLAGVYNEGSPWVFPSPLDAERHLETLTLSHAVRRKLGDPTPKGKTPAEGTLGVEPFTPHDLRRTARSWLARLGVQDGIAEKVIGHKLGGVLGIYNRHPYMDERRAALELWGAKLAELAPGLLDAMRAQAEGRRAE